jgi:magnesium transporter
LLGILSFIICFIFIKIAKYDQSVNIYVTSGVIALSLMISLVITGILGGIIPVIMDKIGVDPAIASGPLITTINDILALVVYFGLATAFMNYIIL